MNMIITINMKSFPFMFIRKIFPPSSLDNLIPLEQRNFCLRMV